MTWQWVVLIAVVLAFVGWESYISMLKERTAIAARSLDTLGIAEELAQVSHVGTNGAS